MTKLPEKKSNLDLFYQNISHLPKQYCNEVFDLLESFQKSSGQKKDLLIRIGKYMALNNAEPEEISNEDIFEKTSPLQDAPLYISAYLNAPVETQKKIKEKLFSPFPFRILRDFRKER